MLKLSTIPEHDKIIYMMFKSNNMTQKIKENLDVIKGIELHFFILGHRKKYHGKLTTSDIYSWILEILESNV